ncbi:hypothetical protein ACQ4M4_19570 [Leptolyngbya sp. AN02str]|uniref:hypothetical protein n=1 Tax=Leptolyngbya sp. AN02str TaxID=3423363 RepID=UPI003D317756
MNVVCLWRSLHYPQHVFLWESIAGNENGAIATMKQPCDLWGNMQITIDLPPDLEQDLLRQAEQSNVPLQTLILRALRQIIQTPLVSSAQWPEAILSYQGIPNFPAFESYRDELLPPRELELF